jgi:putative DNA primase/helicase
MTKGTNMAESGGTDAEIEVQSAKRLLARAGRALDDPTSDAEMAKAEAAAGVYRLYTDSGNAKRLADRRDGQVLYSAALGWLVWDGRVWKQDEAGRVIEMAKKTADSIREDAEAAEDAAEALVRAHADPEWSEAKIEKAVKAGRMHAAAEVNRWASSSESAARVGAMEKLASAYPVGSV